MCGIAGIINLNKKNVNESHVKKMSSFLYNRGPDNEGFWIEGNIGLAHRRLSIIDLSSAGNQPMFDSERSVTIVFNGEIYNYLKLKDELKSVGIKFNTNTDTEVILYGYKVWGLDKLLTKIDGMFAFCLYDLTNQKVFLCRDRFGKKPLYYTAFDNQIYFSSDIRSIIPFISNLELDYESLDFYLTELGIPQPRTIWKNINQVYKASFITINLNNNNIDTKEYWNIDPNFKLSIDDNEAEKLVEQKLIEAILKRTISDVSIGCFLSGGIDSGLVVSLLAQNSAEQIKTFTVGFSEDEYSELSFAKELASRYNTDHTEVIINPKIEREITDLVEYFGEPFADSSAIPTYYVCREMKKHVTVALSGDGGDELFGYSNYLYLKKVDDFVKKYPDNFKRNAIVSYSKLGSRLSSRVENLGAINKLYKERNSGIALIRGMAFLPEEKKYLYSSSFKEAQPDYTMVEVEKIWSKYKTNNLTDAIFLTSLDTRLLNDYLVKVDRASMKSSLEVRSPFLDKDLAELAFSLPNEFKLKGGEAKYILKRLAQKHIDEKIFDRKKQGFGIPVKAWLNNELKALVSHSLSPEKIKKRGFFNPEYIERIIREHNNNIGNHTHKIWSLLWLELWCQKNIDK
jgi:asparagine synthase (glutamine-hydrolysing)